MKSTHKNKILRGKVMDINKYNTRVRQAISDEYIKCSRRKQEYMNKHICVVARLYSEKDTLPYSEYQRLESEREFLVKMQEVKILNLMFGMRQEKSA
jgi:hypothetical protein